MLIRKCRIAQSVVTYFASPQNQLQIEALTTRNLLDKDNLAFLKKQQPLLLEQLEARIEGREPRVARHRQFQGKVHGPAPRRSAAC